jgi:hypothetical protein
MFSGPSLCLFLLTAPGEDGLFLSGSECFAF